MATTIALAFAPALKPTARIQPLRPTASLSGPPAADRAVAAAGYSFPFLRSLAYSARLLAAFAPAAAAAAGPAVQAAAAASSLCGCAAFALGAARRCGGYARKHWDEAVSLYAMLIVPAMVKALAGGVAPEPARLMWAAADVVAVFVAGSSLYGMVACVLGKAAAAV